MRSAHNYPPRLHPVSPFAQSFHGAPPSLELEAQAVAERLQVGRDAGGGCRGQNCPMICLPSPHISQRTSGTEDVVAQLQYGKKKSLFTVVLIFTVHLICVTFTRIPAL